MIQLELQEQLIKDLRYKTIGTCMDCKGEGYTIKGAYISRCHCFYEFWDLTQFVRAGIAKRYWNWTPDSFTEEFKKANPDGYAELQRCYSNIEDFMEKGTCVFLHGSHGLGKTAVAIALLRAAISVRIDDATYKYKGAFVNLSEVTKLIGKAAVDSDAELLYDTLCGMDIIVIDEFDSESRVKDKSMYTGVEFGSFFNMMYNKKVPIILISNSDVSGLKSIHTPDVIDRINHFEKKIKLVGESYREKSKKNKVTID